MVDVASITAIVSGLKTATDIANFLKVSKLSLEKAEARMKVADLISALADIKMEVADMQQEIIERDKEIQKLKETFEIRNNLRYENHYYWLGDETNKDGPFCQTCYDSDQKLIRLHSHDHGLWLCKVCKNHFYDSTFEGVKL